jgi:hypothetical protein
VSWRPELHNAVVAAGIERRRRLLDLKLKKGVNRPSWVEKAKWAAGSNFPRKQVGLQGTFGLKSDLAAEKYRKLFSN